MFAVLDLPGGTFIGAGVKTVVLFFEKGKQTKNIWFYKLNLNRNLGKTNPLNEVDLKDFISLFSKKTITENSWNLDITDINKDTWDLSVKNPNPTEKNEYVKPEKIITEIEKLNKQSSEALQKIKELL